MEPRENFLILTIFGLLRRTFAQRTVKYVSRMLLLAHRNWPKMRKFSFDLNGGSVSKRTVLVKGRCVIFLRGMAPWWGSYITYDQYNNLHIVFSVAERSKMLNAYPSVS